MPRWNKCNTFLFNGFRQYRYIAVYVKRYFESYDKKQYKTHGIRISYTRLAFDL